MWLKVVALAKRLRRCMMWKVKRLPSGLGALQKAQSGFELRHRRRACAHMQTDVGVCVASMHVCLCAPDEGRPIKKLPEERAFSWASVGGWGGRAIVCPSPILRGGITTFLLLSAGRFQTTATPRLIRAGLQKWHRERN